MVYEANRDELERMEVELSLAEKEKETVEATIRNWQSRLKELADKIERLEERINLEKNGQTRFDGLDEIAL